MHSGGLKEGCGLVPKSDLGNKYLKTLLYVDHHKLLHFRMAHITRNWGGPIFNMGYSGLKLFITVDSLGHFCECWGGLLISIKKLL